MRPLLALSRRFCKFCRKGKFSRSALSSVWKVEQSSITHLLTYFFCVSLVELCRSKPAPANSAIRSLGEWLLENNPRRLAAAKLEEAREQAKKERAELESKRKQEDERMKVLPNQGRAVPREGPPQTRVVFAAPGVTDDIVQRISEKFGYTALSVPAAADGAVSTFKEVYADLKMRMKKAANHKFIVSLIIIFL